MSRKNSTPALARRSALEIHERETPEKTFASPNYNRSLRSPEIIIPETSHLDYLVQMVESVMRDKQNLSVCVENTDQTVDHLDNITTSLNRKMETLQDTFRLKDEKIALLKNEVEKLREEINAKVSAESDVLKEAAEMLTMVEQDRAALEEELLETQNNATAHINELQAQVKSLTKQIQDKDSFINEQMSQFNTLLPKVEESINLRDSLSAKEMIIQRQKHDLEQSQTMVQEAKSLQADHERDMKIIISALEGNNAIIRNLQTNLDAELRSKLQLQQRNEQLEAAMDKKNTECENLDFEYQHQQQRFQKEKKQLSQQIESLQSIISDQAIELERSKEMMNELQTLNAEMNSAIKTLNNKMLKHKSDGIDAEAKIDVLTKINGQLQKNLEDMLATDEMSRKDAAERDRTAEILILQRDEKIHKLEGLVELLESERSTLQLTCEDLQAQLEHAINDKRDAQISADEILADMNIKLETLHHEKHLAEMELENQTKELASTLSQIHELHKQIENNKTRLPHMVMAKAAIEKDRDDALVRIEIVEKELRDKADEVKTIAIAYNQLKLQMEDLENQNRNLESELRDKELELERSVTAATTLRLSYMNLEAQFADQNVKLSQAAIDQKSLNEHLRTIEEKKIEVDEKLRLKIDEFDKLGLRMQDLNKELEMMKNLISDGNVCMSNMKIENDKLTKMVLEKTEFADILENQLVDATKELKNLQLNLTFKEATIYALDEEKMKLERRITGMESSKLVIDEQLASSMDEIRRLNITIDKMERLLGDLLEEKKVLENALKMAEAHAATVEQESSHRVSAAENQVDRQRSRLTALIAENHALESKLTAMQDTKCELEQDLTVTSALLEEMECKLKEALARNECLERIHANSHEDMSDADNKHNTNSQLDVCNHTIAVLSQEKSAMKMELDELHKHLQRSKDESEDQLKAITAKVLEAEKSLERTSEMFTLEKNKLLEQICELQSKLSRNSIDDQQFNLMMAQKLKAAEDEMKIQVAESLANESTELRQQIEKLESSRLEVQSCNDAISKLENTIVILKNENAELQEGLSLTETARDQLEHELDHANSVIAHLKAMNISLKTPCSVCDDLSNQILSLQSNNSRLESELFTLAASLKSHQESVDDNKTMSKQFEASQEQRSRMEVKLCSKQSEQSIPNNVGIVNEAISSSISRTASKDSAFSPEESAEIMKSQILALEQEIGSTKQDCVLLRKKVVELEEENSLLSKSKTTREEFLSMKKSFEESLKVKKSLEERLRAIEIEKDALMVELEEVVEEKARNEDSRLLALITELKQERDEKVAEIAVLKFEKAKITNRLTELQSVSSSLQERVAILEQDLNNRSLEFSKNDEEKKIMTISLIGLQETLSEKQIEWDAFEKEQQEKFMLLTEELKKKDIEISQLRLEGVELSNTLKDLQSVSASSSLSLQDDINSLQDETQRLKLENLELLSNVKFLQEAAASKEQELQQLKQDLHREVANHELLDNDSRSRHRVLEEQFGALMTQKLDMEKIISQKDQDLVTKLETISSMAEVTNNLSREVATLKVALQAVESERDSKLSELLMVGEHLTNWKERVIALEEEKTRLMEGLQISTETHNHLKDNLQKELSDKEEIFKKDLHLFWEGLYSFGIFASSLGEAVEILFGSSISQDGDSRINFSIYKSPILLTLHRMREDLEGSVKELQDEVVLLKANIASSNGELQPCSITELDESKKDDPEYLLEQLISYKINFAMISDELDKLKLENKKRKEHNEQLRLQRQQQAQQALLGMDGSKHSTSSISTTSSRIFGSKSVEPVSAKGAGAGKFYQLDNSNHSNRSRSSSNRSLWELPNDLFFNTGK